MKRNRRAHPLLLHKAAKKLLWLCLVPILLTLIGIAVYAYLHHGDPTVLPILRELLHTVAFSAMLAVGGALLLDYEIRRRE